MPYAGFQNAYPNDSNLAQESLDEWSCFAVVLLTANAAYNADFEDAFGAQHKLAHLRRAFRVWTRTQLPVFHEMRNAILARDEAAYFRQVNAVNALGAYNWGISFCTNDELLELTSRLDQVLDAQTSAAQKEPMAAMQAVLDRAYVRDILPPLRAIGFNVTK